MSAAGSSPASSRSSSRGCPAATRQAVANLRGIDDRAVIVRQLGREPRALAGVAVRCPHGRPAVLEQRSYLEDGEPFPTTYYLSCPHAVRQVSSLEAGGGVARWEALVASDEETAAAYREGAELQRRLRRPEAVMRDGGAALALGIGGTARDGAVKCLHAHVAFALAQPRYRLGARMAHDASPLFPEGECCTP